MNRTRDRPRVGQCPGAGGQGDRGSCQPDPLSQRQWFFSSEVCISDFRVLPSHHPRQRHLLRLPLLRLPTTTQGNLGETTCRALGNDGKCPGALCWQSRSGTGVLKAHWVAWFLLFLNDIATCCSALPSSS